MDNPPNWQGFFEELGALLQKNNFMISDFTLGVALDDRIKLVKFNSDGKKVYPIYYIPEDLIVDKQN